MRVLGLDIGSRSVDAVWLDDGRIVDWAVADSGFDPGSAAAIFVDRGAHDAIVSTGYGRHAARERFGGTAITEITAYGIGAAALHPDVASVLDIGGQDTKVISLGSAGKVTDFEMNDKCAAGTGKFLEVMARALGFTLEEMAAAALAAKSGVVISSMCTVFAESEVTGLVHRGEDRGRIARGLHESIVTRTLGSLRRIGAKGPLVFAGGVAKNPAMVELVAKGFDGAVLVPAEAQTVGAFGAALCAARSEA
ncbi:MAG: acyl-CoA dehydratase activase [Actinomycetota bacterium]|nr:MAG: CoA-substrate-specific enzyme activase [Actinomycetota bacterium]MDO8949996.1 acyl-CoA dehydratase activase [Actinomycetota bacterium]MDP3630211.1 acyl-CoA dehydratase activase [Actinomycetota bacterium]